MISIAQDTWEKLTMPTGSQIIARLALPETTSRLYCAIDARGIRHLLITLFDGDEEYYDTHIRGINVITKDLTIHEQSTKKFLDIECNELSGHTVLNFMGGEIAELIRDTNKQPSEIVKYVLTKWRRFWGEIALPILTYEEQLGLFGELWFLSEWLIPTFGLSVIKAWRGPWGSRHDFEWADKSVEVKATTNTRGRIHKIHGLSQLEPPDNGPLYLTSDVKSKVG